MEILNPAIAEYTWNNKPSTAPSGQIICITDIGENGILCRGNGTKWVRMHPTILYNLGTPVALTGTTTETTLLTIPIKGGLIGRIARLNSISFYSLTNNANPKYLKAKVGATVIASLTSTNQSVTGFNYWTLNLNDEALQRTNNAASTTLDTSVNFDLVITGQLTNAADSITLAAQLTEII